jgi:broad specificity phosphatase PhoE
MILLARHGETADNRERRFQGQGPVPLNELGRAQAHVLADVVAAHDPPIAALYASPLPRALETAEIVSTRIGLRPTCDVRFAETDTGDWTGVLMDDVEREDPEGWAAYHRGGAWRFPGGESLVEQAERVLAGLQAVRAAHPDPAQPVLVVCHRGVIRVVLCHRDGPWPQSLDRFHDIAVDNGTLVEL